MQKIYVGAGNAFIAIRKDGAAVTWGDYASGGGSVANTGDSTFLAYPDANRDGVADILQPNGAATKQVKDVVSNTLSTIVLLQDGTTVMLGNSEDGPFTTGPFESNSSNMIKLADRDANLIPDLFDPAHASNQTANGPIRVEKIFPITRAYVAIRSDGSVVTWGQPHNGGASISPNYSDNEIKTYSDSNANLIADHLDPSSRADSAKAVEIFHSNATPAALFSNGGLVLWGGRYEGGALTLGTPVVAEHPSDGDNDGDGMPNSFDPNTNGGMKISKIFPNGSGMLVMFDDNSLKLIGDIDYTGIMVRPVNSTFSFYFPTSQSVNGIAKALLPAYGGALPVASASSFSSTAILRSDGSVVSWGSLRSGGNSLGNDFVNTNTNRRYLGLGDTNGNYIADPLDVQTNGNLKTVSLYSGHNCYLALRENGSVLAWGALHTCGNPLGIGPAAVSTVSTLMDVNENGIPDLLEGI